MRIDLLTVFLSCHHMHMPVWHRGQAFCDRTHHFRVSPIFKDLNWQATSVCAETLCLSIVPIDLHSRYCLSESILQSGGGFFLPA